jgi:hypothetical protein
MNLTEMEAKVRILLKLNNRPDADFLYRSEKLQMAILGELLRH